MYSKSLEVTALEKNLCYKLVVSCQQPSSPSASPPLIDFDVLDGCLYPGTLFLAQISPAHFFKMSVWVTSKQEEHSM